MKLFKTVLIIWFVLLGILAALLVLKQTEKTKFYKKFKKFIEDDEEEKQKIIKEYKRGDSYRRISKKHNIGTMAILSFLRKNKVKIRNRIKSSQLPTKNIIKLYQGGESSKKIAEKFNCSDTTIMDLLKKSGIESRQWQKHKKYLPEEKVVQLYQQGFSSTKLAKKISCSTGTITRVLKKHKIKLRGLSKNLPENKIINKYIEGKSTREVAKLFNISMTTVGYILRKNKIKIRPPKNIELPVKKIIELYKEGYNSTYISTKFQSTPNMIRFILRKHNIKMRLKGTRSIINENKNPIEIITKYTPKTIILPTKQNKKGLTKDYGKMKQSMFKTTENKINIREKIISKIQEGDIVLLLESPELSALKEIERQNKKPLKIIIPNNREFKALSKAIQNYKTNLNIKIVNTSVLQYLVDSNEKFDFIWLDYCGAFSYYARDLDILFQKHFNQLKLILTYNIFDPAKDDDSYYFTRVIDYVLSKNEDKKVRLINDITHRYKKQMYNLGFNIAQKKL